MIYKMVSMEPLTKYAPSWDFSIGLTQWKDSQNQIAIIKEWLMNNEKRIINEFSVNFDGGTGLGDESVTSRFGRYNLFQFTNELPELKSLLDFFRHSYLDFIKRDNSDLMDTSIVCWFNVVRNQQQIEKHHHGAGHDVYLSGNFMCDDYPTRTIYQCPYDVNVQLPVTNQKGTLSIFPTCLPHYTTKYQSDKENRVSIAFDIRLNNLSGVEDLNSLPFMNNSILKEMDYDLHTS